MNVREQKGLRPGGFGILTVQANVDELIYNEKQNEVVFVKYLDSTRAADWQRPPSSKADPIIRLPFIAGVIRVRRSEPASGQWVPRALRYAHENFSRSKSYATRPRR